MKALAILAKSKSYQLASSTLAVRNAILLALANQLLENQKAILEANALDLEAAQTMEIGQAMVKRLTLTADKIAQMAEGVREVAALADPLGQVQLKRELDEGLVLTRYSVPIGLIGVIFESRPDAFVQIASLCLKSGNCAILKGGKEALHSNKALYSVVKKAIASVNPDFADCVVLAETREDINELLALDDVIDLMVPRGSNALVKFIKEHTKIPVLGHADGICHIYIDSEVDLQQALGLVEDAKCQYPAVCNAVETLLVNQAVASEFLPLLVQQLQGVELRLDEAALDLLQKLGVNADNVVAATDADWGSEYNDLILSVKIVNSLEEAVSHINQWGSRHTDAIYTTNSDHANQFMSLVDSSSVMCNCSTRFADGFRYGFGAEVGISTSKIHARGPVGLEGLTIYKYRLVGHGHKVRPYAEGTQKFTHKDLK